MKITNVIGANTKLIFANVPKNMPTLKDPDFDHMPVNGNTHTDSISISHDAISLLTAKEKHEDTGELINMLKRLNEQPSEADAPFDDFAKCLTIALRIINGDRVPMKDEQFLAETEPEMYANAIMLQRQNDNPQKFNSLLDDKKDDTTTDDSPAVAIAFNEQPIESVPDSVGSSSSEAGE